MAEPKNVSPISPARRKREIETLKENLAKNDQGTVKSTLNNVVTILRNDPLWREAVIKDEFALRIVLGKSPPWHPDYTPSEPPKPGDSWTDGDDVRLCCWLEQTYGIKMTPASVRNAVIAAAECNTAHPVRQYLHGLQWDGVARVEQLLVHHFGAEDTAYSRNVIRWWMISAVARVMKPGCKADYLLILEGDQGIKKSSAIEALIGTSFFTDELGDLNAKDTYQGLLGKWCVEIGELDALSRADVAEAKKFFSRKVDRYRPSYGRTTLDYPRQCVFIGTTNDIQYLKDITGGRRFWPVKCSRVDAEAIARDRDQLWAEAVALFKAGHAWWPTSEEDTAACQDQQEDRRVTDAWEDILSLWLIGRQRTTVGEILNGCFGLEKSRYGDQEQKRVVRALRVLGWDRKQVREKGTRHKFWMPLEKPATTETEDELVTTLREEGGDMTSQPNLPTAEGCHPRHHVTGGFPRVIENIFNLNRDGGDGGDGGDTREIIDSNGVTPTNSTSGAGGDSLERADTEDCQGGVLL